MAWVQHTLGSLDLLFTDPATSTYFVEDMGEPPEDEIGDSYVNLNDGAGARMAGFVVGKAPLTLDIICLGDDQQAADDARDALQDQIDAAMGGSVITYEYQTDASQPEPVMWRILGGRVRPRWHTGQGNEQIFALAGRSIALAKVVLNLSRT